MSKRQIVLYWICVSLYLLNRVADYFDLAIAFLRNYLNDFLSIPITMVFVLVLFRKFIFNDNQYTFPVMYGVITVLMYSMMFEWLLPKQSPQYVADPWDVIAYVCGGIFFSFYFNRRPQTTIQPSCK